MIEMSIIGIKKKTKMGAFMYDTINSFEYPAYRRMGWIKDEQQKLNL